MTAPNRGLIHWTAPNSSVPKLHITDGQSAFCQHLEFNITDALATGARITPIKASPCIERLKTRPLTSRLKSRPKKWKRNGCPSGERGFPFRVLPRRDRAHRAEARPGCLRPIGRADRCRIWRCSPGRDLLARGGERAGLIHPRAEGREAAAAGYSRQNRCDAATKGWGTRRAAAE